jgi:methyl-accepting chemotaxis protein
MSGRIPSPESIEIPPPTLDTIRESRMVKLLGAFVVVIVLISAIGGYLFVTSSAAVSDDAEQDLETSATADATAIDTWASNSETAARLVSTSGIITRGDRDRIQRYVEELVAENRLTSGARAVHYIDAESTEILASTLDNRVGSRPAEEGAPWAQEDLTALSDDEVIVTAFNPAVANVTVITFVTPVPGDDRAVVYVTNLEGVAAELDTGDDSTETIVVNDAGKTVFHSDAPESVGDQYGVTDDVVPPEIEAGLDGEAGFTETPSGGDEHVAGYAPVESFDWAVVNQAEQNDVFGLQQTISQNLLILVLTAIVGFGSIGATVGRNTITEINTLANKATRIEEGNLDVDFETNHRDEIGDLYQAFGNMRDSIRAELDDRIEEAEQARSEAEAINSHLENKAEEYRAVMNACAGGDLTVRMDTESESEAMAEIAEAYNTMVEQLETTVETALTVADEVDTVSQETSTTVETIETASENVTSSAEAIATATDEQSDRFNEALDEITDLSGTIEEIASTTETVAETSRQATKEVETGSDAAADAIEEMGQLKQQSEAVANQVEILNTEIDEIGEVVTLIDEIAEQTTVLALNASIEAARAGESGEGFGVVASEIKQLADETAEATQEIDEMITRVRESTVETVEEIETMRRSVDESSETINESLGSFEEIAAKVQEVNDGIQSIDEATEQQAKSSQQVATVVEEATEESEQTSSEAGSVAAAAEELTATVTELTRGTDRLADRSAELNDSLDSFEVGQATSDTDSEAF